MTELLLFSAGLVAGVMNAIAGGGGLVTFPIFLSIGMPAIVATATNNIAVLPGQLAASFSYRKHLKKIPRKYLALLVPVTLGAFLGASILSTTNTDNFEKLVPGLLAFALIMFIFQPFLHQHLHLALHGPKKQRNRWQSLFMLAVAITPISIYGGYFGAGFGFIMLAFLGFTKVNHMHQMTALKNLMGACTLIASIAVLYNTGLIDWRQGLIMATGNIIGGFYGARVAQKVSSHSIRIAVIAIGVSTAGYLAFVTY